MKYLFSMTFSGVIVVLLFHFMTLFIYKNDSPNVFDATETHYSIENLNEAVSVSVPEIKNFNCQCTVDKKLEKKFGRIWLYGCDKNEFESYQMNPHKMCPGTIIF